MSIHYFEKKQGESVKSINSILSPYFHDVFIHPLISKGLINKEVMNEGAYIETGIVRYINKSYGWRAPTLKSVEQALDLFREILINKCCPFNKSKYKISIRHFGIEYNELLEEFNLWIRLTIIDHPEFTSRI